MIKLGIGEGQYERDELLCPKCEGEWMHQGLVEVFDRGEDESGSHIHTSAGTGSISVDRDMSKNPSLRRQGIRIHFKCEMGCNSVLDIVQHKGFTLVSWEDE